MKLKQRPRDLESSLKKNKPNKSDRTKKKPKDKDMRLIEFDLRKRLLKLREYI